MVQRVGIIYPGEGDTELKHLEEWLGSRGMGDVEVEFVYSASDGSHAVSSLEVTGALNILQTAAAELTGRCDAAVWACTSGSFLGGKTTALKQLTTMEVIVGAPVTSTSIALVRAIKSIGEETIEVLSPYPKDLGLRLTCFFRENAIGVLRISDLGAATAEASRHFSVEAEIEKHQRRFGSSGSLLVIPDTAIDTLEILPALEERFSRPIITANQASVWDVMRLTGSSTKIRNAGILFQ